jgi:hypothetical protein
MLMVLIPVTCPYCHSAQIIKGGKTETGKQRYHCQQIDCSHRSFVLDPVYKGRLPQIKEQVIDKELMLRCVNHRLLALFNPDEVEVVIRLADEAEVEEMWSFVQRKKAPRGLWQAIEHRSGKVLAYVYGAAGA